MKVTVSIIELLSWLITVISFLLFLFERGKNSRLPYYMAVQGILRACKEKSGFYASFYSELKKRSPDNIQKEEFMLFAQTIYSDYIALMEHIMGSLKAIEPTKDIPFDTKEFTKSKLEGENK